MDAGTLGSGYHARLRATSCASRHQISSGIDATPNIHRDVDASLHRRRISSFPSIDRGDIDAHVDGRDIGNCRITRGLRCGFNARVGCRIATFDIVRRIERER
jgi:hypothetical protein